MRSKITLLGRLVFALWWLAVLPLSAHLAPMAVGTATIQPDGQYSLDLTFDVLAFALDEFPENTLGYLEDALTDGPPAAFADRMDDARARFQKGFAVLAGTQPATVDKLVFPTVADVRRFKESSPSGAPVMLVLSLHGRLPDGARSVAFRLPEKLGAVSLTVVRPGQDIGVLVVNPGEPSTPLPVQLATAPPPRADAPVIAEPSRWEWAQRYVHLGFVHIMPRGLDHILFVLGLFLLGKNLRPLLMQVTAFTIAHSITLALAMYGVFSLPPQIVEPLIALSIAFVAMENLYTSQLHRWRLFVVFAFGLIHGLGFASVLTSLGLPRREFATALVSFNVGVELGQLAVITLAFLAVGWWRHRPRYRRFIVVPASGIIAAIGIFWAVQRVVLYAR